MFLCKKSKTLLAAFLCLSPISCGFYTPYVASMQDIESLSLKGETVNNTALVSVCYDPYSYSLKDADKLAQEECKKIDAAAKFIDTDDYTCSLLSSSIANYVCVDENDKPIIFDVAYRKKRLYEGKTPQF